MKKQYTTRRFSKTWLRMAFFLSLVLPPGLYPQPALGAAGGVCATVKIEIHQELTLERQGFDAHMRIVNGLSQIALENVAVDVSFADEQGHAVLASSDPDNTNALFFIRIDRMENIDDVGGAGAVAPSSAADIHWLIVPAPGSSNGLASGTLYYVGATLTYTVNGEAHETTVSPDYIFVKPMPQLTVDYFLPDEVYGDDAFTPEIEPAVPFSLGVRVKNNGQGMAKAVKIDSAQPKIVDNEQGLLVNFVIEASEVDGQAVSDSLRVNFGDVAPNRSKIARWIMRCALSGRFVEFTAQYSHSDELGGELTSLIDHVNAHFLTRVVRVDLPGRDGITDFLARDGGVYRVYESNGSDTPVLNQTASSNLQYQSQSGSAVQYRLSVPATAGFMYVQLPDPYHGNKSIKEAVRSDGKPIKTENVWLSKKRDGQSWQYFVNLFDANGTDNYTLTFDDPTVLPQAPVLQFIPDMTGVEGRQLSFLVVASDPDGTLPALSATPLPAGAHFSDQHDGHGIFDWTPVIGQAGNYRVRFTAGDGTFSDVKTTAITVYAANDTDGDGMDDQWETQHFGNLNRDGSGDFDSDGFSDLDEFENGTDPTRENNVPTIPDMETPVDGGQVAVLSPVLVIHNSTDPDGDAVTYDFEVYADAGLRTRVASETQVVEGTDTTHWQVPVTLADNHRYTWRVRASDGFARSFWKYGNFFINTANDAPSVFSASRPRDNGHVCTLTPELQVTNAGDVDGDPLTYVFELYADSTMDTPVTASGGIAQGDAGTTAWVVDRALQDASWYFWRVVATDGHGRQSQTALISFYVDTQNSAPERPFISSPADDARLPGTQVDLVVTNSSDPEDDPRMYFFEIDTQDTFDSPEKQVSGEVIEGTDKTTWHVDGLSDNTAYFWRVKASDGRCESDWEQGSFFVNTANDVPAAPVAVNPGSGAWATVVKPALAVAPVADVDRDHITYAFEIYTDEELSDRVQQHESSDPKWQLSLPLSDKTMYYWRARALDARGAAGPWMNAAPFFVKDGGRVAPPENIEVRVTSDTGTALAGMHVYAFTAGGSYTGLGAVTNENGSALFEPAAFAPGDYKFRMDYLGRQFWSETFAIPENALIEVVIAHKNVNLQVTLAGGPAPGARVYLFSESGNYLGVFQETDANGEVSFSLPVASGFTFRADLFGNQYWSAALTVTDTGPNDVVVDAGGGTFQATVGEDAQTPMPVVNTYLFGASGSYLGEHRETDSDGISAFRVPAGTYKVRADYLGYHFWSPNTIVDDDTQISLTVPHQEVGVEVNGVFQGVAAPLEGMNVYLFTPDGSYLGLSRQTDADGRVGFHLPERAYKVRADYLGQQFWSPEFTWQDAAVEIPLADAEIAVTWNGAALQGVAVYVFSSSGAYLNITGNTAATGKARFRLAAGSYKFRADYQGNQYWSGEKVLAADQLTPIEISTGGGTFAFKLLKPAGDPIPGVSCYVFNDQGAYLNLSGTTSSEGEAGFDLASGAYKFRADYMGYSFWSDSVHVPESLENTLQIAHRDVTVRVEGTMAGDILPKAQVPAYLFTPAGAYLSLSASTDANGETIFNLPQKAYKVRADYLGQQFWSSEFTWQDAAITISEGIARVQVIRSGQGVEKVPVYVFSAEDTYLNLNRTTAADGTAEFRLPAGTYKFRADYQGDQFWTTAGISADVTNPVQIDTGGGQFMLSVDTGSGPLAGVNVYVFNTSGAYLGIYGTTNTDGQVSFDLADGTYRFRVDHLGYQFWTDDYQVPDSLSAVFTIGHQDVVIHVTVDYPSPAPLSGVKVYLFSASGSYLSRQCTTDADGQVVFHLPDKPYKVRVDYLGQQFWSDVFQFQDTTVAIHRGMANIHVQRSGMDVIAAKVYLFSASGSYLGWYEVTDNAGNAQFALPDRSFKFRVDDDSSQYWSDGIVITPGASHPIEMDLDAR